MNFVMYKKSSDLLQKKQSRTYGSNVKLLQKYVQDEYDKEYQYRMTRAEFANYMHKDFIGKRDKISKSETEYPDQFFFGKYKGTKISECDDEGYVIWYVWTFKDDIDKIAPIFLHFMFRYSKNWYFK